MSMEPSTALLEWLELYCKELLRRSDVVSSLSSPWAKGFGQSHWERMGPRGTSEDWGPGELAAGTLFPKISRDGVRSFW